MKVILAVFVLLFAGALAARSDKEVQELFVQWMHENGKSYHHEEFSGRFSTWKANLAFVDAHNAEGHSYTVGMNFLADLTNEEYKTFYLGMNVEATEADLSELSPLAADVPTSFDWRTQNAVTPVKNQQQCGSCYTFSTTGSTEGCHAIKTKNLVSLSEQNLVDCTSSYGNQGCNGGLMTACMQYIIANKGIDTEASYPYTAKDGNTCKYAASNSGATLASFTNVKQGDENDLLNKAVVGPVSVAIDASKSSFQLYTGGVYFAPTCSTTRLDHGVLVAGWGVDGGKDFWLVKNSWGPTWGLQGYIEMSRNANNNCGIATMATLPSC